MSASRLLRFEPTSASPGSAALDQSPGDGVALRISGSKPLRVRGELLAECSSWSSGAPAWHELVLYRSDAAGFAVGIKTCRGPMGASDVFHARMFPDLDAALTWLQAFNPTADLGADIDSSDRRISTTEIALRAATLRQVADRVEQQYRVMTGELFYHIDAGE
jgi:hypothetical protein